MIRYHMLKIIDRFQHEIAAVTVDSRAAATGTTYEYGGTTYES